MRTLRIAEPPSAVGADLRATLFALGRGEAACRGVALVGVQPPGCPDPVDAVVLTPTGVVVLAGVDLPAPALALHAPLRSAWQADGWPMPGPDGLPNPAVPALRAASELRRLVTGATGREDVRTVLAVGPYVERVTQPPEEARDDIRVVHPTPHALLPVLHRLTDGGVPLPAQAALELLATLAPAGRLPEPGTVRELLDDEGFPQQAAAGAGNRPPSAPPAPAAAASSRRSRFARWYSLAAYGAGALAFVALVVVLVATSGAADGARSAAAPARKPPPATVDGHSFVLRASGEDADCVRHAFGDVRQALREQACRALTRRAFTTELGGRRAAVAVADLTFGDAPAARAVQRALDVPGGGGVRALASDGTPWRGAPHSFTGAASASSAHGSHVRVAAAVWLDGGSRSTDSGLRQVAAQALRLPPAG